MITLVIIGIVVGIVIPSTQEARRRAEAAAVVANVRVIEGALFDYFVLNDQMPRSAAWGMVPTGLEASLPEGFSFDTGTLRYRWQRFSRRRQRRTGQLGRLRIRVDNRRLLPAIKALFQGRASGSGRRLTISIP